MQCTIKRYLKIVPGTIADYKPLSRFHYRDSKTGPVAAVYKIIDTHPTRSEIAPVVGVIIYSMPALCVQLRNVATKGLFGRLGNDSAAMQFINNNVRTIARVVIEPRYRALGLAYELVEKTMPLLNMPYIEALAVMGRVNPFFEKAGMMKFEGSEPSRCAKLRQGLSAVGIEQTDLVDIERTHSLLQGLSEKAKIFIEKQVNDFLAAYGRTARILPAGIRRTEFLISRLSGRPVYYLWRNAKVRLSV